MSRPPVGAGEDQRLATLRALALLDTAPNEHFDRVTRLVQALFDVPIAVVTFLDDDRQWFKSHPGLSVSETSREIAFCAHTIAAPDVLVVPDTREDPRFVGNPLVTGEPFARFYAGCPLVAADGSRIGTLAMIDRRPRALSVAQTELLRGLAAIVESEIDALHIATLDQLPIGVYRATPEGRILDANPALVALLGYPDRASLLATSAWDLHSDPEERARLLTRAGREAGLRGVETQLRQRDGRLLWVRLNTFVARDAGGRPIFSVGSIEDVTERRLAEDALWESEARLKLLLDQLPAVLWATDAELRFTMSQGAGLASLSLRPNQLAGMSLYEYFGTQDPDFPPIAAHQRALAGEAVSYQTEWGGRTYESHVRPLVSPEGVTSGALGIALDVTERKRLEDSEKERNRRLRSLSETTLAASTARSLEEALRAITDGARTILGVRHTAVKALGADPSQTITIASGTESETTRTPGSISSRRSMVAPLVASDGSPLGNLEAADKDGGDFTEDDETLVRQLAQTASVITDRRRAEEALRDGEERYRVLYEKERAGREQAERLRAATSALGSSLDLGQVLAHILRELQGVVPYDSASIQELRGDFMEVIAGHGFPTLKGILGTRFDVRAADNPNRHLFLTRTAVVLADAPLAFPGFLAGEHADSLARAWIGVPLLFGERLIGMLSLDKNEPGFYTPEHMLVAESFAAPAAMAMENARLYAAARQELAERKRVEEQFRQSQKMEAVGRLAGGIAHDFNNLLGVILGYTELAARRLDAASPAQPKLEQVRKAAERAAALTGQLLAFSRKQVLMPEVLDLSELIADLSDMLQRVLGEDIELIVLLPDRLGVVRADRGQMGQAILNLAVNARDAMGRGGKLILEADNVNLTEDYVSQHAGLPPGPYVMLAVSDTGTGMSPEVLSNIFEPFFTTKEQGTGLGLAMVYGFLKQSDGHVSVRSEVGEGTTFNLYLPRLPDEARGVLAPAAIAEAAGGSETVLLVEDSASLREMIAEVLSASGYRVLTAHTGEQAVQVAQQREESIDLLLTDVVMPGMSGVELADALRGHRPSVKVLFMSGYTDDMTIRRGILAEEAALIRKPFASAALLGKIRETLDRDG